jgi:hypothetical protein
MRPRLALDGAAAAVASRGPRVDDAANLITERAKIQSYWLVHEPRQSDYCA